MPKVEVDSEQLGVLQAAYKMLDTLHTSKDHSLDFKKIVKKVFPTASVAEVDAAEAAQAAIKPLIDRLDKREADDKKEREDREVASLQSRFDKTVKDHGYTEEGSKK